MPKKNCLNCIAYCNLLPDGKCGLGFEIEEVLETSAGFSIAVHPVDVSLVGRYLGHRGALNMAQAVVWAGNLQTAQLQGLI